MEDIDEAICWPAGPRSRATWQQSTPDRSSGCGAGAFDDAAGFLAAPASNACRAPVRNEWRDFEINTPDVPSRWASAAIEALLSYTASTSRSRCNTAPRLRHEQPRRLSGIRVVASGAVS